MADEVNFRELLAYVQDVRDIQEYANTYFPIAAADLTYESMLAVRVARLLIQGRCIRSPFPSRQTGVLAAGADVPAGLREFIEGKAKTLATQLPEFTLRISGEDLKLGMVTVFCVRTILANRDEVTRALSSGKQEDIPLRFEPADGYEFLMFMPALQADPDAALQVTPLGEPFVAL